MNPDHSQDREKAPDSAGSEHLLREESIVRALDAVVMRDDIEAMRELNAILHRIPQRLSDLDSFFGTLPQVASEQQKLAYSRVPAAEVVEGAARSLAKYGLPVQVLWDARDAVDSLVERLEKNVSAPEIQEMLLDIRAVMDEEGEPDPTRASRGRKVLALEVELFLYSDLSCISRDSIEEACRLLVDWVLEVRYAEEKS